QADDCSLPEFEAAKALEKLRGKRIMFVGDSLQRGQWQSLVCLVEHVIPPERKSMKRGRAHSVFSAAEYNATIEFYWAPFLVESNSDIPIIPDPRNRIVRVDSVAKHAGNWVGIDVLVFNTYVWWMSGFTVKSWWGSFGNAAESNQELEAPVSYTLALKTWANWIDANVNPNVTRVFFTTMSPTHQRSADWGREKGIRCFNETTPVSREGHWGTGSDKRIMRIVSNVLGRMKVPVTVINVTQLSEYRIDAHTSVYTELGGKLLTPKQREDPSRFADCIHWCLPGVPDTWNRILYAHLL
ncbi:hypothetical protein M569_09721, partial [Genlisea aurea]